MPSLVEVEEWENYSRTPPPANAETMLAAASQSIRNYCGWYITREIVVEEPIDTTGGTLIALPTLLLVSVEMLVLQGTELTVDTDYKWSRRGTIRRMPLGYCWPEEYQALEGSYTHGYETAPEDLKRITVEIAQRSSLVTTPGVKQKQVGGISLQFEDGASSVALTAPEKSILDHYALERV